MKVLFFISSLSLKSGGPSRSVPMMAKGLSEAGIDVTLLTNYSDDMNVHALDGTSVDIVALKDGFSPSRIEAMIRDKQIDLIQIQSLWSLEYHQMAKICRKLGIPYIITPRGMLEPWSLRQSALKKKLALLLYQKNDLNHSACIYTTSDMEAYNVHNLGIKAQCSVIPNGIETDGYPCRKDKEMVKKQILFLSRIHEKKGIELLIDAWEDLVNDFPEWTVKIVGNGEEAYIIKLKSTIQQKNLEKNMEILAPVFGQAKVELYQNSSLFVLPSYSENFGMVIAEAMSCGVPVITTEFTPWSFLDEEKAGWSIRLNPESLEMALREALSIPSETLYEMGQNASRLVRERYNYRSVSKRVIKLYEWILNNTEKPSFVYSNISLNS